MKTLFIDSTGCKEARAGAVQRRRLRPVRARSPCPSSEAQAPKAGDSPAWVTFACVRMCVCASDKLTSFGAHRAMDRREIEELRVGHAELRAGHAELRAGHAELRERVAVLEARLEKVLEAWDDAIDCVPGCSKECLDTLRRALMESMCHKIGDGVSSRTSNQTCRARTPAQTCRSLPPQHPRPLHPASVPNWKITRIHLIELFTYVIYVRSCCRTTP
jgi:hypothetical protein